MKTFCNKPISVLTEKLRSGWRIESENHFLRDQSIELQECIDNGVKIRNSDEAKPFSSRERLLTYFLGKCQGWSKICIKILSWESVKRRKGKIKGLTPMKHRN